VIRPIILFILLSHVAVSQFSSMVTNDDGSVLYFVTTLKQKGTDQPNWGKIFRADASGIHLYSVIDKETSNPFLSNYYNLAEVDVSGDGRLVARSAMHDCLFGFYLCQPEAQFMSAIDGTAAANRSFVGDIRLSANGNFGLLNEKGTLRVINTVTGAILETGIELKGAGLAPSPNRVIAGDGTFVFSPDLISLWIYTVGTGSQRLFVVLVGSIISPPIIDAAATRLVYPYFTFGSTPSIRRFDLRNRTETVIWSGVPQQVTYTLQGSSNADRFIFLAADTAGNRQAFYMTDTTAPEALTNDPSGIRATALSGNGRICYLLTNQGRVLRMDLSSRRLDQIVGRTAVLAGNFDGALYAPGEIADIYGVGFAVSAATAQGRANTTLNGFRLRIDDSYAAVLAVDQTTARIQIPWDLDTSDPLRRRAVSFDDASESEFVNNVSFRIGPARPRVGVIGFSYAVVHSGFDSVVSDAKPALAGEFVHAYATGLGAVDPPIALGAAAPANPLSTVIGGVTCFAIEGAGVGANNIPVRVTYAGLAPGLIGYYQIDMRLPTDYRPTVGVRYTAIINCTVGPSLANMTFSFPFQPN